MRKMLASALALATATTAAVPAAALAQEVHRVAGGAVALYNLAGHARVVRGSGSEVVVRVTRGGADADDLRIETGRLDGRETLRIIYPDDEVVYPEMGRRSSTTQRVSDEGTFSDGGNRGGRRVRIRGSGSGMEAWADLEVEVPPGVDFELYLAVGEAEANGIEGRVRIDTGSGSVEARNITGALTVDTGSGRIVVSGVRGDLDLDTGSGSIDVSDVAGGRVRMDTGSGRVEGSDIQADELIVDTGSGGIELTAVTSSRVGLDTGSGSVDVELLTDVEVLDVDTGSGSVTVRVPADLGARVDIETGSGGIDLDFPVEVRSVRRDRVSGTIGDGEGRIVIDTGSGSVRLLRR